MFSTLLFVVFYVLWRVIPSIAYSWQLNSAPTQCQDISITVTGSDGLPPYNVLVVPYGPPPFQNKIDVRGVIQHTFDGNSKSTNVPINYPANTQFVAVVSDSAGFGTGGTSAPTTVANSGDTSCFNASQPWRPHFWFFIGPLSQPAAEVVMCNTTRIWWNSTADVEGTPNFAGVIPGGTSFSILPENGITNQTGEGIGFSWLPRINEGTQLLIVAGDSRGLGSGGSAQFTTAHSDDSSCVTAGSPSTTPGAVAGSIATQSSNAALIGGAVGGTLGFLLLCGIAAFFFIRHRRNRDTPTRGSTVYTMGSNAPDMLAKPDNSLSYYSIEPFDYQHPNNTGYENGAAPMVQLTTSGQSGVLSVDGSHSNSGPQLAVPPSSPSRSGSGSISYTYSPPMISTTIIQHTDGGPGDTPDNETAAATINHLPPTYNSLQSAQQGTRPPPERKRRDFEPNRPRPF